MPAKRPSARHTTTTTTTTATTNPSVPPSSPPPAMESTATSSSSAARPRPAQPIQAVDPEQLLDIFKSAALQVTKLYTNSIALHNRARAEGYQECLDDLLAFLDRERLGLGDGDGSRVRRWAADRLDHHRDASASPRLDGESEEDDSDAARQSEQMTMASSPEPPQHAIVPGIRATTAPSRTDLPVRTVSAPVGGASTVPEPQPQHPQPPPPVQFTAPSLDIFSFQSPHPYPNIGDLDLSDSRPPGTTPPPAKRVRSNGFRNSRPANTPLGRGAGSKRKLNLGEIFGLGSIGGGKDVFGSGAKRGRHA